MRKIALGTIALFTLLLLPLATVNAQKPWQDPATARPLIYTSIGGGADQYLQALGYVNDDNMIMISSTTSAIRIWDNRENYGILWFNYHTLLQAYQFEFFSDPVVKEEWVEWIVAGGSMVATVKDTQDLLFCEQLGLTRVDTGVDPDDMLLEDTVFATGIEDNIIGAPGGFCRYGFANNATHPLPDWVDVIIATREVPASQVGYDTTGNVTVPLFVAGTLGNGAIVIGGAEWNMQTTAAWGTGAPKFDQFMTNVLDYIYANSVWSPPPPPEEYYTEAEVDALIAAAVEAAKDDILDTIPALIPDTTMPMALGAAGLLLGLIAIGIAMTRK